MIQLKTKTVPNVTRNRTKRHPKPYQTSPIKPKISRKTVPNVTDTPEKADKIHVFSALKYIYNL
jgi:hypothetical protein